MEQCKNCENQLQEGDKFCSNCGQKSIERLRLKTLLGELASAYLAWDSKLFRSMRLLIFRPGKLSKNYIDGKRKGYVAPMRMYLFFSVIFFIGVAYLGFNVSGDEAVDDNFVRFSFGDDSLKINKDTLLIMDQHDRLDELEIVQIQPNEFFKKFTKQALRLQVNGSSFREVSRTNFSFMLFVLIPLFAWFLKVSYRKIQLDYIEHLIYSLYFHSFMFFTLIVSLVISHFIADGWPLLPALVLIFLYLLIGMKNFYEKSWIRTVTKFLGLVFTYFLVSLTLSLVTIILTVYSY